VRVTAILLILLIARASTVIAQADSILALPKEQQVKSLLEWYKKWIALTDSTAALHTLIQAEKTFAEKEATLLQQQAWLLQHVYCSSKYRHYDKSVAIMLKAAELADRKGWLLTRAECWHYAGIWYFECNKFGPAFEYMQKAYNQFEQAGFDNYPHTRVYADALAGCYYRLGEYEQAIRYLRECLSMPVYWRSFIYYVSVENTLALCYQQLKQYDSAAHYFKRAHQAAAAVKDSFYMGLTDGNLGYTYFLQGNDPAALPLLETDYKASIKAQEWGSAANAAMTLATIHIKRGQPGEAQQYLHFARQYVYNGGARLRKDWYENMYHIYKFKGDAVNMSKYADSLLVYKDSVTRFNDIKYMNQAKLKLETEKHLNKVRDLENQRRQQVYTRNGILIVLLLTCIIGLLWINRQRLKRRKELELVALEKDKARQQLEFARQQLSTYTDNLREKNELLETFKEEISNLRQNGMEQRDGRTENLNRLLNSNIITEEDWKTFRELFDKVYPGFFVRLREKLPDLSPADTRLLTLTKLQLAPKEMAAMLGISYDAIRKARQRLRKKINLPEEGTLDELVEMI
jgi:tetratricopeptide (TPR) repeat protein